MKNSKDLQRVTELLEDLIAEEVVDRTEEYRGKASHYEYLCDHYASLIRFLVEETELDINSKTEKALEAFRRAEEGDARNGYCFATPNTNDAEIKWRCYNEIEKICEKSLDK